MAQALSGGVHGRFAPIDSGAWERSWDAGETRRSIRIVHRGLTDRATRAGRSSSWPNRSRKHGWPRVPARSSRIALRSIARLSRIDDLDMAWFLAEDARSRSPGRAVGPAGLVGWLGREVEHDGPCDLVIARTFDPGWLARINGGPEHRPARRRGLPGSPPRAAPAPHRVSAAVSAAADRDLGRRPHCLAASLIVQRRCIAARCPGSVTDGRTALSRTPIKD